MKAGVPAQTKNPGIKAGATVVPRGVHPAGATING
jgi:hypothetical protein